MTTQACRRPMANLTIPTVGREAAYTVSRIFCIGRNFLDHVREMGAGPDAGIPIFFTKWPCCYVPSGTAVPYPSGTRSLQPEVELVVAMGGEAVRNVSPDSAAERIYAVGVGLDLTRRDLQLKARERSEPWDIGKNFEKSAPIGALCPHPALPKVMRGVISLEVNGQVRQQAPLADMIYSVERVISYLSSLYALGHGDIIMMGTPAGVADIHPGDHLIGRVDGLPSVEITIEKPEA